MGTCINVLGFEILGDRDCDAEHKDARSDRVSTRQDDHTERVDDRQEGRTDRTTVRATNDYNPVGDAIGAVGGAVGGIASGLGSGLTGGLLAPLGSILPIAVAAGGGLVLLYAFSHRKK